MPYCKNCGRQLAENETCNCTRQNQIPNPNQTPPPQVNPQQSYQQYNQYGQPIYNNAAVQQKKSNNGLIIAIVIIALVSFLFVAGILAAILIPSMLGYVKKSKTQAANSNVNTIRHAVDSALTEMEYNSINIMGSYIISSDSSQNIIAEEPSADLESFNEDVFYQMIEYYFDDLDSFDWFVVIENGTVTYIAALHENDDYIGTYPMADLSDGPSFYNSSYKDKNADLEDLYQYAADSIYY